MKLSFVNQPWTIAAPPKGSDSTGIWSYQVSLYLSKHNEIVYYGCEDALLSNNKFERSFYEVNASPILSGRGTDDSNHQIKYRAISPKLDSLLKIP